MSVTHETTLWCDTSGCDAWVQIAERLGSKARETAAREEGWGFLRPSAKHPTGVDWCPDHKPGKRV